LVGTLYVNRILCWHMLRYAPLFIAARNAWFCVIQKYQQISIRFGIWKLIALAIFWWLLFTELRLGCFYIPLKKCKNVLWFTHSKYIQNVMQQTCGTGTFTVLIYDWLNNYLIPWNIVLTDRLIAQMLKKFPHHLSKPKVYYFVHNVLILFPILSKINPLHTILFYFFKIHFNIIVSSMPRSSHCLFHACYVCSHLMLDHY